MKDTLAARAAELATKRQRLAQQIQQLDHHRTELVTQLHQTSGALGELGRLIEIQQEADAAATAQVETAELAEEAHEHHQ